MYVTRSFIGTFARRGLTSSASRPFSSSVSRYAESRNHPNADEYRESQKQKDLNPHMTNTNSAESQPMPSVGADKPPPEFLSSVDPKFTPKDSEPENTERMTGGTQAGDPANVSHTDLGVGEMEGASFRVEPLRRVGEDAATMRARLLCPSSSFCIT